MSSARGSISIGPRVDARSVRPRYVRLVQRLRPLDVAIAVTLTAWMLAEVWAEDLHPVWAAVPLFLVSGIALLWRSSRPILVGLVLVTAAVGQAAAGMTMHSADSPVVAILLVSWSIGIQEAQRRAVLGLTILVCGVWLAMGVDTLRGTDHYEGTDVPWIGTLVLVPGIIGLVFGSRALRFELHQRAAVAEERARIARELHDVIAHSVAVMTVQAGAAETLLASDPARAAGPVRAVQETGREALTEMKRLVGMLREGDDEIGLAPQPGMAQLDALLAQMREAGLAVDLEVDGTPRPLPAGVELSAYRIVQEALTNAIKHADCGHVRVAIRYTDTDVELEVADDGRGAGGGPGGHGLVGMRERAAVVGGTLDASPAETGGFVVRARLPLEAPA
jgi:signal transduction histidine kinase